MADPEGNEFDLDVLPDESSQQGERTPGCPRGCTVPMRSGHPKGSGRISPVLSEMSGTALGAMTQRLPHLGVSSASGESLLSHQMSCRLEVRSQFDASTDVSCVLLMRHGPGVSTLGAPAYLRSSIPSPPGGFSHARSVLRVSRGCRSPGETGLAESHAVADGRVDPQPLIIGALADPLRGPRDPSVRRHSA